MPDEDIRGRLAALEYVAALGLNAVGRNLAATAWPNVIPEQLGLAKQSVLPALPTDTSKAAAEQALERIFNASRTGLKTQG